LADKKKRRKAVDMEVFHRVVRCLNETRTCGLPNKNKGPCVDVQKEYKKKIGGILVPRLVGLGERPISFMGRELAKLDDKGSHRLRDVQAVGKALEAQYCVIEMLKGSKGE